jgi:hypothetical protein
MKVKQELSLLGGMNNLFTHKDLSTTMNRKKTLAVTLAGNNHLFNEEYSNVTSANPVVCIGTFPFSISIQYIYFARSLLLLLLFQAANTSNMQRNPP